MVLDMSVTYQRVVKRRMSETGEKIPPRTNTGVRQLPRVIQRHRCSEAHGSITHVGLRAENTRAKTEGKTDATDPSRYRVECGEPNRIESPFGLCRCLARHLALLRGLALVHGHKPIPHRN
jgi:hypothetical protein